MAFLTEPNTLLQTAKQIAVPLPFFLAGYSFNASQNALPSLYDHKAEFSTPVFKQVYYSGAAVALPGTLLASAASAYLAYAIPAQRNGWAVAAGLVFSSTFVWTPVVMMGNIQRLLAISESAQLQEKASANLEHRQRLIVWTRHNWVRTVAYLVAGITAVRATMV